MCTLLLVLYAFKRNATWTDFRKEPLCRMRMYLLSIRIAEVSVISIEVFAYEFTQ